jgi:catechol 2,3-dioxygenase-like lactoylglutathione lyase family enzyme
MNLNQVTLPCTGLEVSVNFYTRLGFRQIVSSPPRYARFECESGTTFSLHTVPHRVGETGIVVYFEVVNLDSTVARLQESGIIFESMPRDQSWLWRESYLKDPSGNMLCLYHAGSNRRYPPWRLK